MNNDLPDRGLVREYLLGRLDNKQELEEQLSHEICVNDELSDMVESVEEEIIEDVLDGNLNSADKNAVDAYFLRPPERKEKLRFARLLRHHFEQGENPVDTRREKADSANIRGERDGKIDYRSLDFRHSHIKTFELAALALLSVAGLIYISGVRKSQARLEVQLAQARKQIATVATGAAVTQASMIALTLVSDRSRGDSAQIPNIEVQPSTQRIVVEIALQGRNPGPFDVTLEARGKNEPIWSARLLPLVSAAGDARLVFDVPAQTMPPDVYSFAVSSSLPASGRPKHYDFRITPAK